MKKQNLDKTKQQFKLGETVYAVAQKDSAPCLLEGKICGVSKSFDDESEEVKYTIDRGIYDSTVNMPRRFFVTTYDSIFKELEVAQQKALDTLTINYNKTIENLTNTVSAIRTVSEKQETTVT